MSTVIIKPPNLPKLRAEQEKIFLTLQRPPSPIATYMTAPLPPLTNVYHSRDGRILLIETEQSTEGQQQQQEQQRPRGADGEDAGGKQRPLLADLLSAASRVNLDVEKTLALACNVLSKARSYSPELSEEARQSLGRITEFGNSLAILPPPSRDGAEGQSM